MIRKIGLLLCLCGLFTQAAVAQKSLNAARITGGSTNAHFTLGLTLDNGSTYPTAATTADNVSIIATIEPETIQLDQPADIFVVALIGTQYYMRNAAGNFVPWNFAINELVPYLTQQRLTHNFPVEFIKSNSKIPVTGTLSLFLGYKAADGVLIYTPAPHQISISAPATAPTTLEQATALFASTISPNIVQSPIRCISCHVAGGAAPAAGAGLIFVTTSNSNDLNLNFNAIKNFTKANGSSYILSKVSGGLGHIGGPVLPSGSTDYNNFNSFLQLVEKL